jgi:hypothetical protein
MLASGLAQVRQVRAAYRDVHRCDADQRIDDPRKNGHFAEDRSYEVKSEQAHQAPVEATYYNQNYG